MLNNIKFINGVTYPDGRPIPDPAPIESLDKYKRKLVRAVLKQAGYGDNHLLDTLFMDIYHYRLAGQGGNTHNWGLPLIQYSSLEYPQVLQEHANGYVDTKLLQDIIVWLNFSVPARADLIGYYANKLENLRLKESKSKEEFYSPLTNTPYQNFLCTLKPSDPILTQYKNSVTTSASTLTTNAVMGQEKGEEKGEEKNSGATFHRLG